MPRYADNDLLDYGVNRLKTNGDLVTFCAGQPTTYAEATEPPSSGGRRLVNHALTGADWTIGDGSSGGRSAFFAAQDDTVDEDGTGDHIAYLDTANSKILYVNVASEQPVQAGQSFQFPADEINAGDPIALT